ncbi:MAG: hypothetical protein ABR611_11505 [Chthoniobacterales bacterium]
MQSRTPELSTEQISKWMRAAATQPRHEQAAERGTEAALSSFRRHPGFDFKNARQSLGRARAKNDIDTIKPLRRLRRNQGAINEALIDTLSALIAVNKQMAGEIAGLSGELATLRQQLAESDASGDRAGKI